MRAWQLLSRATRSASRCTAVRWPTQPTLRQACLIRHFRLLRVKGSRRKGELAAQSHTGDGSPPVYKPSRDAAVRVFTDQVATAQRRQSDAAGDIGRQAAVDSIGESLLKAQQDYGINLLHVLAVERGQWSDVVWVAKELLAHSSEASFTQSSVLHDLVERTDGPYSLQNLTDLPVGHMSLEHRTQHAGPHSDFSIGTILDSQGRPGSTKKLDRQHRILGTVWSALGTMTIACVHDTTLAGGMVKPEILEVLALFHRHGFVSPNVYTHDANTPVDAIQQPVVLHLLSSRIITTLTDAEWRAQEKLAIDNAKASGNDMNSVRRELRGSSVRAYIEALRPEIWVELILWSCVHGGWISSGAEILDALCRQTEEDAWTAISWREKIRQGLPFGDSRTVDWEALKFQFDTKRSSSLDEGGLLGVNIERTISSEVVSAYVDAFTSAPDDHRRIRGVAIPLVIARLRRLQQLLRRSEVFLHNRSWDTIVQRLLEFNVVSDSSYSDMKSIVKLSPAIGEELSAGTDGDLPSYVFDGNAAMLGLLHRALRAQIDALNMTGASNILKLIVECVDDARRRSLADLFRSQQSATIRQQDLFTSNFSGIDYPMFDAQMPPSTIASYIDLVTSYGFYELGKMLFMANDIEESYLPRRIWGNAAVAPALARFANAIDDKKLLETIVEARLKADDYSGLGDSSLGAILNAILSSHIATGHWRAAIQLMLTMQERHNQRWAVNCLAVAARSIMLRSSRGSSEVADEAMEEANTTQWSVFEAMLADIDQNDLGRRPQQHRSARLYSILGVLSTIDQHFHTMLTRIADVRSFYCPPAEDFDVILSAVAESKGCAAAQKLIEDFMNINNIDIDVAQDDDGGTPLKSFADYQSDALPATPWFDIPAADGSPLTVRTSLVPTIATMRIIIKQAFEEWKEAQSRLSDPNASHSTPGRSHVEPQAVLQWVTSIMLKLAQHRPSIRPSTIQRELTNVAHALGMSDHIAKIPDLGSKTTHLQQSMNRPITESVDRPAQHQLQMT